MLTNVGKTCDTSGITNHHPNRVLARQRHLRVRSKMRVTVFLGAMGQLLKRITNGNVKHHNAGTNTRRLVTGADRSTLLLQNVHLRHVRLGRLNRTLLHHDVVNRARVKLWTNSPLLPFFVGCVERLLKGKRQIIPAFTTLLRRHRRQRRHVVLRLNLLLPVTPQGVIVVRRRNVTNTIKGRKRLITIRCLSTKNNGKGNNLMTHVHRFDMFLSFGSLRVVRTCEGRTWGTNWDRRRHRRAPQASSVLFHT